MNMNPLTHSQEREMYSKFPGVEEFIIKCILNNEIRYLEDNEYILSDWEKERLQYLRDRKQNNGGYF